jgi:predicted  nucleic acid-binding Zn-ribbon protein
MDIHEAVVCLANWRAETARLQAAQQAMMKAVTESPEYKRLGEEYVHAHQMESETEDTVRQLAVEFYKKYGEQPHEAVSVKEYIESSPDTILTYEWKAARATIAPDLSAYL